MIFAQSNILSKISEQLSTQKRDEKKKFKKKHKHTNTTFSCKTNDKLLIQDKTNLKHKNYTKKETQK